MLTTNNLIILGIALVGAYLIADYLDGKKTA